MSRVAQRLLLEAPKAASSHDAENGRPANGRPLDPRNLLNDLAGPEWLQETKSFFFQKGLGAGHPHATIEREHPAPFSFQDVQRLISFFTKRGHRVLDPFSGVGSTSKACSLLGRQSTGIELSRHWHTLAKKRMKVEVEDRRRSSRQDLICGDARKVLRRFRGSSFHFIVTSPPYWSILNKEADHKAMERIRRNLATRYSLDASDLGNVMRYEDFLDELVAVFLECGRLLKSKRYMALVVSDFRHGNRLYSFHSDLIQRLQGQQVRPCHRLVLQGVKILLQNHKSLKPYGYPFAYVENIHHQYVLLLQKQGP